jgi:HSP20 family molecular chaperone IbpA
MNHGIHLREAREPSPPDALRTTWPTFAEPLDFAPPLAVEESDEAFRIDFHVAGRGEDDLEVVIEGQTLFILGEALPRTPRSPGRARRAFALPATADPSKARLCLVPPVLQVHVGKSPSSRRRVIVVRTG